MIKYFFSLCLVFFLTPVILADDYIVIVFDTSGSMQQQMRAVRKSRLIVAQDALISTLNKLPATTKVGILTFNGWSYDLGPIDKQRITDCVRGFNANGGTPLYDYIAKGTTRLLEERKKNNNVGSYKLLVVTDGEAGDLSLNQDSKFDDNTIKPGVINDVKNRGIIIDVIGLEVADNYSLKDKINGTYMKGDDPDSIEQSLTKSIAEVKLDVKDSASKEMFEITSNLPESFVKSSIIGLTQLQNHPIGTKPPKVIVEQDGTIKYETSNEVAESSGLWKWIIFFVGLPLVFLGMGILVKYLSSR